MLAPFIGFRLIYFLIAAPLQPILPFAHQEELSFSVSLFKISPESGPLGNLPFPPVAADRTVHGFWLVEVLSGKSS
jgi:hypothetical protein